MKFGLSSSSFDNFLRKGMRKLWIIKPCVIVAINEKILPLPPNGLYTYDAGADSSSNAKITPKKTR